VTFFKYVWPAALACALLAAPRPAAAQAVTPTDIARLQDGIADASRDIAQLRTRDSAYAGQLQTELDDARDDATYYKVKLRRNEPVTRSEFSDLRDHIADIGRRARGDDAGAYRSSDQTADRTARPSATGSRTTQNANEIPVGTEFDVSLQSHLSSKTAQVEDRFEATTMVDLRQGSRVLVPAGSVMRGVVSSVTPATRVERKGSMTVAFDRVTIDGRSYPIRATVTQAIESEGIKGETAKIGTGAGVGAIIGGILGGVKGAMAGILIGGGGTIAATEGQDVDLAPGTTLRVRMDSPLVVR
jgi:hypothetical protein